MPEKGDTLSDCARCAHFRHRITPFAHTSACLRSEEAQGTRSSSPSVDDAARHEQPVRKIAGNERAGGRNLLIRALADRHCDHAKNNPASGVSARRAYVRSGLHTVQSRRLHGLRVQPRHTMTVILHRITSFAKGHSSRRAPVSAPPDSFSLGRPRGLSARDLLITVDRLPPSPSDRGLARGRACAQSMP